MWCFGFGLPDFGLVGLGSGIATIVIVATIPFWLDVGAGVVVLSVAVTVGVSVSGVAGSVIRTVFALFVDTERETISVVGVADVGTEDVASGALGVAVETERTTL